MQERSTAVQPSMQDRLTRVGGLLKILVPRAFRVRYRESLLDLGWSVITPVVLMAVYGVILTQAFKAEGGCAPYLSSAWLGLVVWTFFASALGECTNSLLSATGLTSKIYFPRDAIPLAEVGVTLIDFAISMVTVVLVAAAQGLLLSDYTFRPSLAWFAAIPALLLVIVWTSALGIFASAIAVFFRDLTQIINLVLRAGFFITPVMYETSFLGPLRWMASVNPIAVGIDSLRETLLCGQWPRWPLLMLQLGLGSVLLVASIYYMRSIEQRMADVL